MNIEQIKNTIESVIDSNYKLGRADQQIATHPNPSEVQLAERKVLFATANASRDRMISIIDTFLRERDADLQIGRYIDAIVNNVDLNKVDRKHNKPDNIGSNIVEIADAIVKYKHQRIGHHVKYVNDQTNYVNDIKT